MSVHLLNNCVFAALTKAKAKVCRILACCRALLKPARSYNNKTVSCVLRSFSGKGLGSVTSILTLLWSRY